MLLTSGPIEKVFVIRPHSAVVNHNKMKRVKNIQPFRFLGTVSVCNFWRIINNRINTLSPFGKAIIIVYFVLYVRTNVMYRALSQIIYPDEFSAEYSAQIMIIFGTITLH